MAVIVISRAVITIFACLVSWCGLTWHIGFTIQNRFTWGLRASYIPLLQRILLNFIWNAVQCKLTHFHNLSTKSLTNVKQVGMEENSQRITLILLSFHREILILTYSVCITAIWPSFAQLPNTLSPSVPTTTYEMVGFIVFWVISVPFLFIRPEYFKRPFQFISIYCGLGMICMSSSPLSIIIIAC